MPADMIREAQKAGNRKFAVSIDLREAFLTFVLGPLAQQLSTFTTPVGRYRWKHGWFGFHSFPGLFQVMIMTKVILPTAEQYGDLVSLLCWIDDIIVSGDTEAAVIDATLSLIDRILAIGGRISLEKCIFLDTKYKWCGVEVDLKTQQWRVAPDRVASLNATPIPSSREQLIHVIGVLRYYWHAVANHHDQRAHIAVLLELDVPGICVRTQWKERHTVALRAALAAVTTGDWLLVYDPSQPVIVTTDASGNHGYSITVNQYDKLTGKPRPIAYISKGWIASQLLWVPQVKECYAQREAVVNVMRTCFPYATVVLLCDNRNLTTPSESANGLVERWQFDIRCSGAITRYWIKGLWNSIADFGSRSVNPSPTGTLSESDTFEQYIYSILSVREGVSPASSTSEPSSPLPGASFAPSTATTGSLHGVLAPSAGVGTAAMPTAVLHHLHLAPILEKIVAAQEAAGAAERATWKGVNYSSASLGGRSFALYKNRLVVPSDADDLKTVLMRMAHDDSAHFAGVSRTIMNLHVQARVHWVNLADDVEKYVSSCYRCQYAKPQSHVPKSKGELNPTLAPSVHHTWYADLKGPMPHGTGYILAIVEAVTRLVKLRYLPNGTAKEVIEEMQEAITSYGTCPVLLRSDNGPPFNSADYAAFCTAHGITPALGIPYHSQGQGLVETRFRPLAASLMATLGHKAPRAWWTGRLLDRLEGIINSTFCEPIHGSPHWAMYGVEPRTPLYASTDWTSASYGQTVLGAAAITYSDVADIIACHHDNINAVQGRVLLSTSLAQALTKRTWDGSREKGDFKVGEHVLVHRIAPNRLLPHFIGPYIVTGVSVDGNFVSGVHFNDKDSTIGPAHVSRLLHFNASRATTEDLVDFQLEEGSYVVDSVIEHRVLGDGSLEFHLRWRGTPITSWMSSSDAKTVIKIKNYCSAHGLPTTGPKPPPAASIAVAPRSSRTRGRRGALAK
jgi:hypothetical protein